MAPTACDDTSMGSFTSKTDRLSNTTVHVPVRTDKCIGWCLEQDKFTATVVKCDHFLPILYKQATLPGSSQHKTAQLAIYWASKPWTASTEMDAETHVYYISPSHLNQYSTMCCSLDKMEWKMGSLQKR